LSSREHFRKAAAPSPTVSYDRIPTQEEPPTVAKTKPTSKKNTTPGFKGAGGPPPAIKGNARAGAPGGQKTIKPKAK
jgi:hypothetical protein